jgi:hypothetical protein
MKDTTKEGNREEGKTMKNMTKGRKREEGRQWT